MQPNDQQILVVELLHQGELLLQVHRGGTADRTAGLGVVRQLDRHEAAGIKDQVGLLEESFAPHRHELRIAGTGTDDFDVSATDGSGVLRQGEGKIVAVGNLAFLLLDQQGSSPGAFDGGGFGHAGAAGGRKSLFRRVGHVDGGQGFRGIDGGMCLRELRQEGLEQGFVFLQFNGADRGDGFRREAFFLEFRRDGFRDAGGVALPAAAEAQVEYRRSERDRREFYVNLSRRNGDKQTEIFGVQVPPMMEDGNVLGAGLFEGVSAGVSGFEQEGGGLSLDKGEDGLVHPGRCRVGNPAVLPVEGVEGPEAFVIALRRDDGVGADLSGDFPGEVVGAADVAGGDGDDVLAGAVDAEDGGVVVFIFQRGGDAADADAQCADEDDGFEFRPVFFQEWSIWSNVFLRIDTYLVMPGLIRHLTAPLRGPFLRRVHTFCAHISALICRLARRKMLARRHITR